MTKREDTLRGKAFTIDSHCGPAWLGFGHTFAIELEHDQAIAAYSTAAKLYPGSHLPTLFIVGCALFSKAQNALKVAEETKCRSQVWETIWINLSHASRQLG
ncbi:hypothetical protein C2G38_2191237 [Gigaspora rosea]|uniref:Uncharacterized protein n=1 Tax=Gigaspora rosea TaxID=44941 RepID=A0A397V3K1_9GLOM|nr:hypothetical protein C2G38_2191237 [Gigaspora rosea]